MYRMMVDHGCKNCAHAPLLGIVEGMNDSCEGELVIDIVDEDDPHICDGLCKSQPTSTSAAPMSTPPPKI